MKNAAVVVFRKEMARFFGDKRLFFTTVILPGLIIFLMYSIMGEAMTSSFSTEENTYNIVVENMPDSVAPFFEDERYNVINLYIDDMEYVRDKISQKDYQLCVVFPENFDEVLAGFKGGNDGENAPNVEVFYNSADILSSSAYSEVLGILSAVEEQVSNVFNINYRPSPDEPNIYDVATDEETSGVVFAMILPMLLMTLMYSSCMALAPESIAGEKERGTIASLLITPIPRNRIIIGKVLALSAMALMSGISSFLGTLLSMPALMGTMEDSVGGISAEYYSVTDYLWLVLVILSTVILFITLISIFSTFAKTVKEASTLVMPMMILVMLVSFSSMYSTSAKEQLYWYAVPVYNSVQCMIGVFSFNTSPIDILVTVAVNIVCSAAGLLVLTKMFNDENIMFGK